MKRPGILLLVLLLLGIAYWQFCQRQPRVVDYPKAGTNIIAFGNSLVLGYGASQGNDFVSVLSSRLGVPIINAGRNGDTTETGLQRLPQDVLSKSPRIVIVLLGGNDALRRVPLEETFSRLGAIIDQVDQTGAAVILVGVRGGIFADRYRSEFERLAGEKQVNYVPDILNGIFGDPRLMADPIHPNDEGNARVADRVEPLLRELLGKP